MESRQPPERDRVKGPAGMGCGGKQPVAAAVSAPAGWLRGSRPARRVQGPLPSSRGPRLRGNLGPFQARPRAGNRSCMFVSIPHLRLTWCGTQPAADQIAAVGAPPTVRLINWRAARSGRRRAPSGRPGPPDGGTAVRAPLPCLQASPRRRRRQRRRHDRHANSRLRVARGTGRSLIIATTRRGSRTERPGIEHRA